MSQPSLQEALLNRLARIANAKSESKSLRRRLACERSELAQCQHDLKLIEEELYVAKFPAPYIDVSPVVELPIRKRETA